MNINLKTLGQKVFSDLQLIADQAQRLGFSAYLVGGVVRDLLLKQPSVDHDIVVEGQAIDLAKAIATRAKATPSARSP